MKMGACCSGGTTVDQVNLVDKGGGSKNGSKNKVEPSTPQAKTNDPKQNKSDASKTSEKPTEPCHRPLLDQENQNQNKKTVQTVGNLPPPLTTKDGISARVQKLEYNLSAIHPEEITEIGAKLQNSLSIINDNPDPDVNLVSLAEQLGTTDLTKTIWAASMIQRWYRKYCARLEQKRRATWKVFSEIEYADEQDEIGLYNFFSGLLTKALPQIETLEKESANLGEVPTEAYTGLRVNFPLNGEEVSKIKNHYKKEDSVPLHISYTGILKIKIQSYH